VVRTASHVAATGRLDIDISMRASYRYIDGASPIVRVRAAGPRAEVAGQLTLTGDEPEQDRDAPASLKPRRHP
jgi:hypothetical protein